MAREPTDMRGSPSEQTTAQLLRSIVDDIREIVRKEIQLARQELLASLAGKAIAVGAFVLAAILGLLVFFFVGETVAAALDPYVPAWAARLIVAGGYIVLAALAAGIGITLMKRPTRAPKETKRTVKEGVEWAKTQLRR
ncbi:MAG: phage holin family protein [Actinomycetota bacterium]